MSYRKFSLYPSVRGLDKLNYNDRQNGNLSPIFGQNNVVIVFRKARAYTTTHNLSQMSLESIDFTAFHCTTANPTSICRLNGFNRSIIVEHETRCYCGLSSGGCNDGEFDGSHKNGSYQYQELVSYDFRFRKFRN